MKKHCDCEEIEKENTHAPTHTRCPLFHDSRIVEDKSGIVCDDGGSGGGAVVGAEVEVGGGAGE